MYAFPSVSSTLEALALSYLHAARERRGPHLSWGSNRYLPLNPGRLSTPPQQLHHIREIEDEEIETNQPDFGLPSCEGRTRAHLRCLIQILRPRQGLAGRPRAQRPLKSTLNDRLGPFAKGHIHRAHCTHSYYAAATDGADGEESPSRGWTNEQS